MVERPDTVSRMARERAESAYEKGAEVAGSAYERGAEIARAARVNVGKLDVRWAHGPLGDLLRESIGTFFFGPAVRFYTRRRIEGREHLRRIKGPVVIVANHNSHMDTPAILRALPRGWRKRTVVGAAADYFYKSKLRATLVSIAFNTVPIDRQAGRGTKAMEHIDQLLRKGNNLLLYPEGSRKSGGRLRHGAANVAAKHGATIVPIYVRGTGEAMPPGQNWPRLRRGLRRHPISITIGRPITPPRPEECARATERVAAFFDQAGKEAGRDRRNSRARRFRR